MPAGMGRLAQKAHTCHRIRQGISWQDPETHSLSSINAQTYHAPWPMRGPSAPPLRRRIGVRLLNPPNPIGWIDVRLLNPPNPIGWIGVRLLRKNK